MVECCGWGEEVVLIEVVGEVVIEAITQVIRQRESTITTTPN